MTTAQRKRKNSKNHINKKVLVGVTSSAIATGIAGYSLGVIASQDVQDFQPDYTVSSNELKLAKSKLANLSVRNDFESVPDYSSSSMPGWYDADNDGCPTRYDILVRDMLNEKVNEPNCEIKSGTMFDYYTGTLVKYNRLVNGGGIDIDHVVAKGNAWLSGGYKWSNQEWKEYINDENVLMATSAKANRSKGDKDAVDWLPSNESFQCKYIIKQVQIKDKYNLSISTNEKMVMENILNTGCVKSN